MAYGEAQKRYYQNHKDKCREASKSWRDKNPEQVKITSRAWWEAHPELRKAYQKDYRAKLKLDVLNYYSGNSLKCAHCGIADLDVLCIDHIADNGSNHRRELFGDGRQNSQMYWWLRKNNYPEGYQILCWNCNHKKEIERQRNGSTEETKCFRSSGII